MKDYYIKMQQKKYLMQSDIEEIVQEYTNYLTIDLDNLSNIESLITHQKCLIDIEQYLILIQKTPNQKIQTLISIYDTKIQKTFNQFSKKEREKLMEKYELIALYNTINDIDGNSNIEKINSIINSNINKLNNDLRLLNNLKMIEFDGYNILKRNNNYKTKKLLPK